MKLWKINCMEDRFPGMWQRWLKQQCVAVGWAGKWGYHLSDPSERGRGWMRARRLLNQIKSGDRIIVSLRGHRVGMVGEVTGKAVGDEDWAPLVPPRPKARERHQRDGEMGRRIFVRWDLQTGPDDRKLVVALPENARLTQGELRPTIAEVRSRTLRALRREMNNPSNWVGLSQFSYERSLSDYIGTYPHLLEDGLLPHPNSKIRERVFADGKRLDVLLEDRKGVAVIVECKQDQPTINDVRQLQHYLKQFRREEGKDARGILVHGGARKLRADVRKAARAKPIVELVQFDVHVEFSISG